MSEKILSTGFHGDLPHVCAFCSNLFERHTLDNLAGLVESVKLSASTYDGLSIEGTHVCRWIVD